MLHDASLLIWLKGQYHINTYNRYEKSDFYKLWA